MKANDIRPIPLQYTATTSEASYRRLEAAMLQMGHLRNALIRHRNSARGSHRFAFNFKLQNAHLTDLHRHDPEFNPYARRLLESVAKEVNKSYRTYFNNTDTGRPQTASPYRNRTLEISEPANQHLKFSKKGWATIRVKGLPVIRFRNDKRLPENEQPKVIRITLKPRRLDVSLTYHSEPKDIGEPTKDSVGIDPGIKQNITAVSNDGAMWQTPGFNSRPHLKTKRRLLRKMQRQRDAALKHGRARFISQKTHTGKTKRRFPWTDQPSQGYLNTLTQLRRVEQKRQDSMRGYQPRLSHQLVRDHQIVCIEDTKTANTTRSAKGTVEQPGKNVRQKSGLNRSILAQGWYSVRTKIEYKTDWYGRQFVAVPAHYTSQRCSRCEHVATGNRVTQAIFKCLNCGHQANADINAAENIRRQGLQILAKAGNSPGRTAGDPSGQQAHQTPSHDGPALYAGTRSPTGVAKFLTSEDLEHGA